MKNFIVTLLFLGFVCSIESCREETIWMDTAFITAYDARRCVHPCCGGYFIMINDETYRFLELPEGNDLELSFETPFPLEVKINWHIMENGCAGDEIILEDIKQI